MSQENVELVRAQYEHLNRFGEPKREDYAADAIFDSTRIVGFGIYRDRAEFVAAWLEYRDTFDEWGIEVDEVLDGPEDRVFVALQDGGRMKASGGEVRNHLFHVWELRDGKIAAWTVFLDRSPALEAAGLA